MIEDQNGNEMTYWPISGLTEGEHSETIRISVLIAENGYLQAAQNSNLRIYARFLGTGDFADIADSPVSLDGPLHNPPVSGRLDFEIYAAAVGPISGLERVALSVSASKGSSADWGVSYHRGHHTPDV